MAALTALAITVVSISTNDHQSSNQQPVACRGYYALTFDDGPNPTYTRPILKELSALHAKATFFLIGENAVANPKLVRVEARAGHWAGNHTWTHPDLTQLGAADIKDELTRTSAELDRILGEAPGFARPPYGDIDQAGDQVFDQLQLSDVLWTVDTRDWDGVSVRHIVQAALRVTPGGIILMHDAYPNTVKALPQIVPKLRAKGLCPGRLADTDQPLTRPDTGQQFYVKAVAP